jgi:hypothetical protein
MVASEAAGFCLGALPVTLPFGPDWELAGSALVLVDLLWPTWVRMLSKTIRLTGMRLWVGKTSKGLTVSCGGR